MDALRAPDMAENTPSLSSLQAQRLRMRSAAAAGENTNDDDLLLAQQRFLLTPSQAAAKVTRAPHTLRSSPSSISSLPPSSVAPSSVPPRSASRGRGCVREDVGADDEGAGLQRPSSQAAPSVLASVLSAVVERDLSVTAGPTAARVPLRSGSGSGGVQRQQQQRGFPVPLTIEEASIRSVPSSPSAATPKQSLFALQRQRMRQCGLPSVPPSLPAPVAAAPTSAQRLESSTALRSSDSADRDWRALPGDGLARELSAIRAENERRLAAMSAAEVEEAQEELSAALPPALLAALRKRGATRVGAVSSPSATAPPHRSPSAINRRVFGRAGEDDGAAEADSRAPQQLELKEAPQVHAMRAEEKKTPSSPRSSIPPSPSPFADRAKTAWMVPVPSPASPPDWAMLTWDSGIASSTTTLTPSATPSPPIIGTAWSYWRVDFRGRWLSGAEEESDRYDGLYHHGDHAERAGYSMQEVVYLCHSSNAAQRQLVLTLLTHVLARIHARAYAMPLPVASPQLLSVDFNALVLEHLMVMGVVTVLRVALDDPAVGVMTAAVRAMEALLCREDDERRRRDVAKTYDGHLYHPATLSVQAIKAHESPFGPAVLDVNAVEATTGSEPSEETNENASDEAACMRDVIAGLVQMRMLPRLRYLLDLEGSSPSASTAASFSPLTVSILHVLVSVAQHSPEAARAVSETPHLLPLLASLPRPHPDLSTGNTHLLTLLSILAATSSVTAAYLSSHSAVLHSLAYVLIANGLPGQLAPPLSSASLSLSALSLRLWRTTIAYGKDVDQWLTFFPVVMGALSAGKVGTADVVEEWTWQQRQCWDVLEGLCGCVERAVGGEERDISASHLSSSVDHAFGELSARLLSPPPSSLPPYRFSTLAGMAHLVASYYRALPSSSTFSAAFSRAQVERHWTSVFSRLHDSALVGEAISRAMAAAPPSWSSSFCCFPSASMTSPALVYVDFLLALCRWLHASLCVDDTARAWLVERLRGHAVFQRLVGLLPWLTALPVMDTHCALLSYEVLSIAQLVLGAQWERSATVDLYRAAVVTVPVLRTCGYAREAETLTRDVVLSVASLSWLQTQRLRRGWEHRGAAGYVCTHTHCEWRSKDWLPASVLQTALLPVFIPPGDAAEVDRQGAIACRASGVDSLVLRASTSPLTVHRHSTDATWLLLPLRDGLFLSALTPSPSPLIGVERRVALSRAFVQFVGLLLDCELFLTAEQRTVVVRAVMELFLLGSDVYSDPSLTPSLTHLTHQALPSPSTPFFPFLTAHLNATRGWGYNFFLFFHALLDRYQAEGMQDDAFTRFVLIGLQRGLPKDYRLAVFGTVGAVGGGGDEADLRGWAEGWWWPREDSVEVLRCYREYVERRCGERGRGCGALGVVAMHHLLCQWLGEDVVRNDSALESRESLIRSKMGTADESVTRALCAYRHNAFV